MNDGCVLDMLMSKILTIKYKKWYMSEMLDMYHFF